MLTYILSCTVSELLQIISQICAFDEGYLSLTHSFGWTPKLRTTNSGLKKLETLLYCVVWKVLWYLKPFRRGSQVWRTNGQTDRQTERWKWPAVPFPRYLLTRRVIQLLVGVWPTYLSLRSAGSLTAQTLNSLDNTCHCLSRYTRAQSCRPRAVIRRQRLSLRSSRQWAGTVQLLPVWGRVTDRAPTTTVRALRDVTGPQNDADGRGHRSGRFGTTWQFVTTWRFRATGWFETTWQFRPSRPPLSRWSSCRANSLSAKSPTPTRKHSALLAVLRLLLRSWWLLFFLCSSPFCVNYFCLLCPSSRCFTIPLG